MKLHHNSYLYIYLSAGNNWGCNETHCCVGCGQMQENFWNCADIRIHSNGGVTSGVTTTTDEPMTTITTTEAESTTSDVEQTTTEVEATTVRETTTQTPETTTMRDGDDGGSDGSNCRATSAYSSDSMDEWCRNNCAAGYCPSSHCTCEEESEPACTCKGAGAYATSAEMRDWCCVMCALGYCPPTHCEC